MKLQKPEVIAMTLSENILNIRGESEGVFRQFDGARLGDVAEIEAQMFIFVQKFNRRTELEFSTSAAILPNRC